MTFNVRPTPSAVSRRNEAPVAGAFIGAV
jgi:hypothetical protein